MMTIEQACEYGLRDIRDRKLSPAALAELAESYERDAGKLEADADLEDRLQWAAGYRRMAARMREWAGVTAPVRVVPAGQMALF